MTVAKTIPKPVNWQDFETLCQKIFRYEWPCPSITKNGRSGQAQHGVDISGIPEGRDGYWGVQCKGKDEYTHAQLTRTHVDEAIRQARSFRPPLEALIIATSANKDATIEQHVREADLASREEGGFGIAVYHWEDLAGLIEEHRRVFDWWMRDKRHRQRYSVEFGFDHADPNALVVRPRYRRVTKIVRSLDDADAALRVVGKIQKQMKPKSITKLALGGKFPVHSLFETRAARSWCTVPFRLTNSGDEVLEDYELELEFNDDNMLLDDGLSGPLIRFEIRQASPLWTAKTRRACYRGQRPLVQSDSRLFEIGVKPEAEERTVQIGWRLFARDFYDEGALTMEVNPDFEDKTEVSTTTDPSKLGETVEIEEVYADEDKE
jgi:hypothetical protein